MTPETPETQRMSLTEFIAREFISMECTEVDTNPHMVSDPEWSRSATHYKCRLTRRFTGASRKLTVYFSMGSAHTKPPTVEDVLNSIASDSEGVDGSTFEQWCAELGFDTDSRKAYRTYQIRLLQAEKLKVFLGDNGAYEQLLYRVERL